MPAARMASPAPGPIIGVRTCRPSDETGLSAMTCDLTRKPFVAVGSDRHAKIGASLPLQSHLANHHRCMTSREASVCTITAGAACHSRPPAATVTTSPRSSAVKFRYRLNHPNAAARGLDPSLQPLWLPVAEWPSTVHLARRGAIRASRARAVAPHRPHRFSCRPLYSPIDRNA